MEPIMLTSAMKVVLAHNRYVSSQPSGENTIVDAEIAQLTAAGVTVLPLIRRSDDIATLPAAEKALLPLSPIYNRSAVRELTALIDEHRPDVLHLHNPYPLLSPAIVTAAHRRGLPVVQTVHNYRHVCTPGIYFRDGRVCTDCRGKAFGWPGVRHACYRGSRAQSLVMATSLAANRGTWRRIPTYVALTDVIADHLRDFGIPDERIVVKPNGVPDPGPPPSTLGAGFVFVGRLTEEKGLRLLLDAWRRHPVGALGPLKIIGDGPLRSVAESAAAERSDVEFTGQLPGAAVRDAIRAAAVLVAPSTWPDVLPTVIIEALANGRPALGTDLGGIPFVIGSAGWVAAPTVDTLADGLAKAAAEAPGLTAAARSRYEEDFTPEVNVRRLLELYATVSRR
jgi:glycosyltransferase involved in cell wall biosynthesis